LLIKFTFELFNNLIINYDINHLIIKFTFEFLTIKYIDKYINMETKFQSWHGPFDYLIKTEIITIVMIATFFTWRFLISFHDQIVVPLFDGLVDDKNPKKYIKIFKKKIDVNVFVTELLKWIFIITVIYCFHSYYLYFITNKN
jgi:hypothetical protein